MQRNGLSLALVAVVVTVFLADGQAARLAVVPRERPQFVFGGQERPLEVVFHNSGAQAVRADVRARLFQASSATAAPVYEVAWKSLQVLPGQTVIETAALSFPGVQAETRFLIRWIDGGDALLGVTDVRVFPTNLLTKLRALGGESPVGVFDPADQLRPLLRKAGVPFQDLLEDGTDKFFGNLAVFGPFPDASQMRGTLGMDIRKLARRGRKAVWLQPPAGSAPLRPSFQVVRFGDGIVVVAQQDLVSRPAENPEAQLNLIRLAEIALHPARLDLAAFEPQTDPVP